MSNIAVQGGATGTGTVTLLAPATSTDRTITLPDATGTVLTTATAGVPIGGPAFSAGNNATQSISSGVATKVLFQSEEFDTNSNFASSTFTPTVAGYYQVIGGCSTGGLQSFSYCAVHKNGTEYKRGLQGASTSGVLSNLTTALVYCNGSTDFVEIYWFQASGTSQTLVADATRNYFQAAMVRSAT